MPLRNVIPILHEMRHSNIHASGQENLAKPADMCYEGREVARAGGRAAIVALGEGWCEEFEEVGLGGFGGAGEEAVRGCREGGG